MDKIFIVMMVVGFITLYIFPSIVANANAHKNTTAICVLNLLLGWTLLGWVIALVWACCDTSSKPVIVNSQPQIVKQNKLPIEELNELAKLKEKGIITEEEFKIQKSKLLDS